LAAAKGFVTVRPDAAYGDNELFCSADQAYCELWTCPGSGAQEISEVGFWGDSDAIAAVYHMAFFTDAGEASGASYPVNLVTNSDTGEISFQNTTPQIRPFTYGTKPILTGGAKYWFALGTDDSNLQVQHFDVGIAAGDSISDSTTYPNWSTSWSTHTDREWDNSFYAIYAAQAGGLSIPYNPWLQLGPILAQ